MDERHSQPARLPSAVQAIVYGRWPRRVFLGALRLAGRWENWRFERGTLQAARINDVMLLDILRRHRDTAFGRAHGFAAILRSRDPVAEYRRRVPLAVYHDFEHCLERMAAGESGLLTADRVVFFAPSSGTTGRAKMIPITRRSAWLTLRALLLSRAVLNRWLPDGGTGRGLSLVRMSENPDHTSGGIPTGDASAFGMRQAAWLLPWLYTTPLPALGIADKPAALFIHALFALRERDLDHISATFAHYVVQFFRVIEKRWPELLDSLATGRLPPQIELPAALRQELESLLRPDPELAARLRPDFENGMRGIGRRLWPRLACVAAVTTGTFEVYLPQLREYLGATRICNLLYGATEAQIGISLDPDRPQQYVLIPGSCAAEFIPAAEADNPSPSTVGVAGLRPGECYELVITNHAGFYRYRMDDVVRVTGFRAGSPILEFAYRRGTILNLAAEKTTEEQVASVVRQLHDELSRAGARVVDYTVAADVEAMPPRYRFFMEIGGSPEPVFPKLVQTVASGLDAGLAAANVDYASLRRNHALGPPRVDILRPGSFEALLDLLREQRGRHDDNTLKVARCVRNASQLRLLESLCVSSPAE